MSDQELDAELRAIAILLGALEPLSNEARLNVVTYVFRRLGIEFAPAAVRQGMHGPPDAGPGERPPFDPDAAGIIDIRSFKEEKQPKTASEMVAVAAYYLAHLAPPDERRDYIVADDIRRYFLQAVFPLPSAPPHMTLVNAKNAGYLDARERGQYRLNPVGYNLITNKLPPAPGRPEKRAPAARKRAGSAKPKSRG